MDVLGSALRHGVDSDDIQHALRHAIVVEEVAQEPTRYLVLGPDRAANLLELVVLDRPIGTHRHPRDADETAISTAITKEVNP
ncbi:MAG TPA: hypothetical protein VJ851_04305 [Jatrophihabitans sp.]|nr:hypothetical protein [Jatrophihabitans sp.]